MSRPLTARSSSPTLSSSICSTSPCWSHPRMLSLVPSLEFLITRLLGKKKRCLDILPNDILIDQIFDYLAVIDILRLRQVSKLYYYLSHYSIVWKRLLLRYEGRLPPLPPTSRHSYANIIGIEAERLLTRAVSLEKTWSDKNYLSHLNHCTFDAHHAICQMVLLPGSHYLVASVSDSFLANWAIVVYAMDHRFGGLVALAKTSTQTKAFHLQAKYMTIQDIPGIVISYVRRDPVKSEIHKDASVDVSEYSGEPEHLVEPEIPIMHECVTMQISLSVLQSLSDLPFIPGSDEFLDYARDQRPPFRRLALMRSKKLLGPVTLDEAFGDPYLAIVKDSTYIMFKNLNRGAVSTMTCSPAEEGFTHTILAIKMLPCQNQIIVARRIESPADEETNGHPIELYDILPSGQFPVIKEVEASERWWLDGCYPLTAQISDHGIRPHDDASIIAQLDTPHNPNWPLPVAIMCRTKQYDDHYVRIVVFPRRVENDFPLTLGDNSQVEGLGNSSIRFKYSITTANHAYTWHPHDPNHEFRVIPGGSRFFKYEIAWDDIRSEPDLILIQGWKDLWHQSPPEEYELFVKGTHALSRDREALQQRGFYPVDLSPEEDISLSAAAYDESIGRLCLATNCWVRVLDFARAPQQDRGQRMPLPVLGIDGVGCASDSSVPELLKGRL